MIEPPLSFTVAVTAGLSGLMLADVELESSTGTLLSVVTLLSLGLVLLPSAVG